MAKKKKTLHQEAAARFKEMRKRAAENDKIEETLIQLPLVTHLKNTVRPGRRVNFMHMSFEGVDLKDSKTQKQVGSVAPNMGGSLTIHDTERGEQWTLTYLQLFEAYQAARKQLGELPPLPKDQRG